MRRYAFLVLIALQIWAADPFRPAVHFSPQTNWTNDPCGLVYANGEYHLFFQFNPFGDQWGHMSWGHATSRDLIHWTEQPVAIPEANDVMIFTGSAVVDQKNSSGLCNDNPNCIAAIYTGHREIPRLEAQHLAISTDNARTFKKYDHNPVLDRNMGDFRDPKVFWHAPTNKWVMLVLAPLERKAYFYGSVNLKNWNLLSSFGPQGAPEGMWECPDIFELPVENSNPGETRWVFKTGINPGHPGGGSGEQYFVGTFDGTKFINDNPASTVLWLDHGRDCYCALTWNHEPGKSRSMMGWMSNWDYASKLPTEGWRGQMTLPRTIALRRMPEGLRVVQKPITALDKQRNKTIEISERNLEAVNRQASALNATAYDIDLDVDMGSATRLEISLRNAIIAYSADRGELSVDRRGPGLMKVDPKFPSKSVVALKAGSKLNLRMILDADSVEVFAAEGSIAITNLIFPEPSAKAIFLSATGGAVGRVHARISTLNAALPQK